MNNAKFILSRPKYKHLKIATYDETCVPVNDCNFIIIKKYIEKIIEKTDDFVFYVEIGVKFGNTFIQVVDYCCKNNLKVHCIAIDLFEDFIIQNENTHRGDVAHSKIFKHKLIDLGYEKNITVIKGDSHKVIPDLIKMKKCVGFIDGNHTYEYVKKDYELLVDKIDQGFVVLDDVNWPTVRNFFNELPDKIKIEKTPRVGVTQI